MLDLFIFCAEKSGDLLGYNYVRNLLERNPNTIISGVLGDKMSSLNCTKFMDAKEFSVMGFIAVFKKIIPLIIKFYSIKRHILKQNPKTLLLIDAPDFTLRMARSLRKSGFKGKIIQYVCPSIWAWRKGRKKLIEKYINELICLLPFEPELFKDTPVKAYLALHPFVQEIEQYNYPFSLKELKGKKPLLLLPGSRIQEIKANLPLQLEVAKHFKELTACILVSSNRALVEIVKIMAKADAHPHLIEPSAKHDIMKKAHIALCKCGSSNLELALHATPSVIMYKTSRIDHFLAQYIFKLNLPFFSLPNLILKQPVFTEHINPKATQKDLVTSINRLLSKKEYEICQKNCYKLKQLLLLP
jgi:lipid-A-disaccharide synthase